MIDLHCHLLPGIDDGPEDLAGSLALARAAVAAGTTAIVATPHISWDYPQNTAAAVAAKADAVRAALAEHAIALEVLTGGEIAMTRAAELPEEELVALRLGGGPYLMIECPLAPVAAGFELLVSRLRERGHRIVLAHPERSPVMQRDYATLERMVADGALTQITAGSLVGRFGGVVQDHAERMLREGLGHDVASDAHSADRRPPSIAPELADAGLGPQADWLGRAVPHAILTGELLPPAPDFTPAPRRGLLGRLLGK